MNKLEQRLQEFRAAKRKNEHLAKTSDADVKTSNTQRPPKWLVIFRSLYDYDLLNFLPFRLWHQFYDRSKKSCIFLTLLLWISLQITTAFYEFGSVFFLFSSFLFIFLTLGRRKPGEPSAYSVFNPRCERLLGTLTADQLEENLLLRNKL